MDEFDEILNEIKILSEAKRMKSFLEAENARLKSQIDSLTGELEGMEIAISSAESYIAAYEGQREKCSLNIEKLKTIKEDKISEIDSLHVSIKTVKEDKEASLKLNESLNDELNDIIDEKSTAMRKISAIQTEIDKIALDKDHKLPNLKWYSSVLKKIYREFIETQNRMEVAIMFSKK